MLYSDILLGKPFETQIDSLTDQVGPIRGSHLEHSGISTALSPAEVDLCDLLIFHKCTNLRGST